MFIFNKKRITFLLASIFLPIGVFMLNTASNNLKAKSVIETMATPVTSRTIIIDARSWWRRWWSCK